MLVFGQAFDLKRRRISQTIEIRHDLINIVVGGGHVTTSPTRCEGEEQKQTKDDNFFITGGGVTFYVFGIEGIEDDLSVQVGTVRQ